MINVPLRSAVPQLGCCACSLWRLRVARHSFPRARGRATGRPATASGRRVLELAAPEAAEFPALMTIQELDRDDYVRDFVKNAATLWGSWAQSEDALSSKQRVSAMRDEAQREQGSTNPAQKPLCRLMPAYAMQNMAFPMEMVQQRVPVQYGTNLPGAPPRCMYLPAVPAVGAPSGLTLQERFHTHVMCNYTPVHPSKLPRLLWVSCECAPFEPGTHRTMCRSADLVFAPPRSDR